MSFRRAISATFGVLAGLLLWPAIVVIGLLVGLLFVVSIAGNLAR